MYDIRQFKPALYLLLLLGFSGFALAAEAPGLCVLSVTALVLNAWMLKTRRFTPIPHWLANAITFLALLSSRSSSSTNNGAIETTRSC
jgi:4-hydroxybenzoate polyprenyltransferase